MHSLDLAPTPGSAVWVYPEGSQSGLQILESALQNVSRFYEMGGLLAEGTDAGAWAVPHGCNTEKTYFAMAGLPEGATEPGNFKIMEKF